MTDRPYTDATVALVAARLTDERGVLPEFAARRVLDDLAEAGLLVTPRIEHDARWLGRAYIWRRPGAEPVVLNPIEVDVVLPLEAP